MGRQSTGGGRGGGSDRSPNCTRGIPTIDYCNLWVLTSRNPCALFYSKRVCNLGGLRSCGVDRRERVSRVTWLAPRARRSCRPASLLPLAACGCGLCAVAPLSSRCCSVVRARRSAVADCDSEYLSARFKIPRERSWPDFRELSFSDDLLRNPGVRKRLLQLTPNRVHSRVPRNLSKRRQYCTQLRTVECSRVYALFFLPLSLSFAASFLAARFSNCLVLGWLAT